MCGRVYIKTTLEGLMRAFAFARSEGVGGLANQFPRYNGAPTQTYPIIIRDVIRDPDLFGPVFVSARWGLIPRWAKDAKGGGRPPPINVRCETISTNGLNAWGGQLSCVSQFVNVMERTRCGNSAAKI